MLNKIYVLIVINNNYYNYNTLTSYTTSKPRRLNTNQIQTKAETHLLTIEIEWMNLNNFKNDIPVAADRLHRLVFPVLWTLQRACIHLAHSIHEFQPRALSYVSTRSIWRNENKSTVNYTSFWFTGMKRKLRLSLQTLQQHRVYKWPIFLDPVKAVFAFTKVKYLQQTATYLPKARHSAVQMLTNLFTFPLSYRVNLDLFTFVVRFEVRYLFTFVQDRNENINKPRV